MIFDEYDTDEVIEKLKILINFINNMREFLIKYELKYDLKYDSRVPSDIFNRMCLLVKYLDKMQVPSDE